MKHPTAQKGFTIIETLVAITVLMIAIAGPLVVASKGLFGADLAKDQLVASYLAQESMEAVKNIRDNNIYAGSDWLSGLSSYTYSNSGDASPLDGSSNNPSTISCVGAPCPLYHEANGYGHVASGATASIYTRRFYVHDPTSRTAACASTDECGVTVEVYWNEANIVYSVVLTSEITSTIR
jgi:prepilin-type N-terminal cleavage/methylation domain-containing protein